MKQQRVKRTRADLTRELSDQVLLLINACQSYDRGLEPIGKHIALSLRVLLHQHGRSNALLQQLDLRSKQFLDTAGDIVPGNLLSDCPLCVMEIGGSNSYRPLCAISDSPRPPRWLPFERWWNVPVIKDGEHRHFNRRELILHIADTDGGAHVDPALDAAYLALSRENSLGWMITQGDVRRPSPPPTMACMRQMAHEVLETLKVKAQGIPVPYTLAHLKRRS